MVGLLSDPTVLTGGALLVLGFGNRVVTLVVGAILLTVGVLV